MVRTNLALAPVYLPGASPAGGQGGIAPRFLFFFPDLFLAPPLHFFLKVSIALSSSRFRRPPIEMDFGEDLFFLDITCFWLKNRLSSWFRPAEKAYGFWRRRLFFGDHLFLAEKKRLSSWFRPAEKAYRFRRKPFFFFFFEDHLFLAGKAV